MWGVIGEGGGANCVISVIQDWMIVYDIQEWMTGIIQNWIIIVCFCSI